MDNTKKETISSTANFCVKQNNYCFQVHKKCDDCALSYLPNKEVKESPLMEEIENWIGWLQARIEPLKAKDTKGAYEFWLKQALQGYADYYANNQTAEKDREIEELKKQQAYLLDWQILTEQLKIKLSEKEREIEKLRIQLAACGVAAQSNTEQSIKDNRITRENECWSASYEDVCIAVDREIEYRTDYYKLKSQLSEISKALEESKKEVEYWKLNYEEMVRRLNDVHKP